MKTAGRNPRKFPGKVTSMLYGIACITEAAIDHVSGLTEEDTTITTASLKGLRYRIDNLTNAVLSADNAAGRRREQAAIRRSTKVAAAELASLKTFIETAFAYDRENRSEILIRLGFRELYRKAVNFGQPKFMGALLKKVAGNLDEDLEASLILAGLPPQRCDAIRELADHYHDHTTAREGGSVANGNTRRQIFLR
jgi:hypothetical protein